MVGREQQLLVSMAADTIRCRMTQPIQVVAGTKVGLNLSLVGAKLFDAISGKSLADLH